jgi:hypothetical protein
VQRVPDVGLGEIDTESAASVIDTRQKAISLFVRFVSVVSGMSDPRGVPAAGFLVRILHKRTESLKNTAWAIKGEAEKITSYVPLGPTDLQKVLLEGMSHAGG